MGAAIASHLGRHQLLRTHTQRLADRRAHTLR